MNSNANRSTVSMEDQRDILHLIISGLNKVSNEYYEIKNSYAQEHLIRERAFCYELYHQIRIIQKKNKALSKFTITGEIDKRGHAQFDNNDWKNPDFIFHEPGTMTNNCYVIEVKGNIGNPGIAKDLATLTSFVPKYYSRGMLICYNSTIESLSRLIDASYLSNQSAHEIDILCKETAKSKIEHKLLCEIST